ncbi:conserved hypothetical protein [Talaromyces stipitatus ATCC 10500]|uniref:Uncharacterized protein n=1 Tax=Talaromyces stipitatus (strain ATCC 10500 / CBS 375.48 / QM 6759 / NRRL 1006) TaxID=441959 RepID=B8MSL3_TALSN|nr:uncharacterized protein TSTA_003940 [Talaromyces stipitatus ATCC 10500]EED12340.1 conserved hypothetical protein [Talaromyces stipitatus ATCC 10500]
MSAEESKPTAPIVSHGRGGQGNIGADATEYVDGEIVREGPVGDQGDGAYSAGRGGAGNIGSPHIRPSTPGKVHDNVVVPETAVRESLDGDYHIGRGGQGNVHLDESHEQDKKHHLGHKHTNSTGKAPATGDSADGKVYEGLADKLKRKLFGK